MKSPYLHSERRGESFAQKAIASARKTLREASARPNPSRAYLTALERMIDHHRKTRDR